MTSMVDGRFRVGDRAGSNPGAPMTSSKKQTRTAGIDVSFKELQVAVDDGGLHTFDNDASGHRKLLAFLTKRGRRARAVLEATGSYHVDVAFALVRHPRCEVMVVNPRAARHFHIAQGIRAKTDRVDAASLLQFALRMPFQPWTGPSDAALELRSVARFVDQLVKYQTRVKNQLHAANAT